MAQTEAGASGSATVPAAPQPAGLVPSPAPGCSRCCLASSASRCCSSIYREAGSGAEAAGTAAGASIAAAGRQGGALGATCPPATGCSQGAWPATPCKVRRFPRSASCTSSLHLQRRPKATRYACQRSGGREKGAGSREGERERGNGRALPFNAARSCSVQRRCACARFG